MRNIVILFTIIVLCMSAGVMAGEVTYTGQATIIRNDVRSAQKNSLNSALLGGIKSYIEQNSPEGHAGDITADYFVFIKSYTILQRQLVGNSVRTQVRIDLDDTITDEVAVFVAGQVNTAVFFVSGLTEYLKLADIRGDISNIFRDRQFSSNDQIAFEQEIIDHRRSEDVLTAFQSVSSQYLFNFSFTVKDYQAGEFCTLTSDSNYISTDNLTSRMPIIRTEVTVENVDMVACMKTAAYQSVTAALDQVRASLIPAPGDMLTEHSYNLHFMQINDLKTVNDVIGLLVRRKLIASYEMTDMQGDEATFTIKSYFLPSELALRVELLYLPEISEVGSDDSEIMIEIQGGQL